MYGSLLKTFALLGLAATAFAHDHDHGNDHDNLKVDANDETSIQCANGSSAYCCNQVSSPDSAATGVLAGLLDNLYVGAACTPISLSLLAAGSTTQCSTDIICCGGKSYLEGKAVLGCQSGSHRNMRLAATQ
ncbi:hypothetical protein CXG81DRAFT_18128 [Caulochytrium protostelioides]|uniref:Hydrophobin n=1 Tax=Caulochytrium protostelioides TaxID=1555241 RepID=A0A4P9XA06_9FUNG|nr:hypothetical protein CXG81DRAFT_18128 [Caulochytrium protostelioides]|eukprot:RKP02156.1 hypothetical protein CXG81DRAFT_18128 [Caulochytrium protostelioides]